MDSGLQPSVTRHHKIPQIGAVIIEDDVEIGANTTVDRATMTNGATVIKRGTKIDNLVQIAHNVVIGEDCRLAAQVGIAGSAVLKDRVTVAGQAGVVGTPDSRGKILLYSQNRASPKIHRLEVVSLDSRHDLMHKKCESKALGISYH